MSYHGCGGGGGCMVIGVIITFGHDDVMALLPRKACLHCKPWTRCSVCGSSRDLVRLTSDWGCTEKPFRSSMKLTECVCGWRRGEWVQGEGELFDMYSSFSL